MVKNGIAWGTVLSLSNNYMLYSCPGQREGDILEGYPQAPEVKMLKLGLEKYNPDVSWEIVLTIAEQVLGTDDPTSRVLRSAVRLEEILKECV